MRSIPKVDALSGEVKVPASKSLTNRALLLAAMTEGETAVENPLLSDDSHVMLEAIRAMGFAIDGSLRKGGVTIGPRVTMSADEVELWVGNAGTAMRFLTGWLPFVPGRYVLRGESRMHERPIGDLVEALGPMGAEIEYLEAEGYPPVSIRGRKMRGGIELGVSGKVSSQFVSALMMGGSSLPYGLRLRVDELVSRPYIALTIGVLSDFGVDVTDEGDDVFSIPSGGPRAERYLVEGDWSSASYWFAAAAATGGEVTVRGLSRESFQGDRAFLDLLGGMGCEVVWIDDGVTVKGTGLSGGRFDMNAIPDVVPTLAAIAPLASSPVEIANVSNLRVKESDRIAVLASELRKLGAAVDERADGIRIEPGWGAEPATIDPHGDHRIAMSFAIAGLARGGVSIEDERVVGKSYPGFWSALDAIVPQG